MNCTPRCACGVRTISPTRPCFRSGPNAIASLELRQQARVLQFDCALASGRHVSAIPDLRLLVDAEPLRERPRSQLMLALHRAGQSAEALEVYQEGYRISVEATGLDPAPALTELEGRILRNDPDLDWVAPTDAAGAGAITGRRREARRIEQVLAEPCGEVLVFTGEAGIGKTHLLDHVAGSAARAGATVAWGIGHPGNQAMTLAPWRAVLTTLVAPMDDDALRPLGTRRLAELAHLLPELAERLKIEPADSGDEGALHEAVVLLLLRVLTRSPLVLCCDDVQWYDMASVRLLSSIVAAAKGQPLVVAAGWRTTESASDAHAAALAELASVAGTNRFELDGLDGAAVTELWEDMLGAVPGGEAVERLTARTGGNPLFVTELLRARSAGLPPAPTATMQDLITTQVASLPQGCRDVLIAAALCPDGATERLLSRVCDLPTDSLTRCLDALVAKRLLVEVTSSFPAYVVRHSVIAECVTSQLSAAAQARRHNRIAEALQSQNIPAGRLAHHFLGGGSVAEPVATATTALAAARYSAGLHDHTGAIHLIERGLVALERSDDDQLRGELLVLLAQQRKHEEYYTQAHTAAHEAFRLARRAGDVDLMVKAALVYCGQNIEEVHYGTQWLGYWHPPGPALEMLAESLEKLEPGTDVHAIVQVAFASQLFGDHHDPALSRSMLDEAEANIRAMGKPGLLSSILHYRMTALQRELTFDERRLLIEEGLALVDAGESPHREIVARRDLMILRLDDDDLDGARTEIERSLAAAARADDATMSMLTASMATALDIYQGRFGEAEQAITESMDRFSRMGHAGLDLFGIQLAALSRERGRHREVAEMLSWKLSGYPGPAYGFPLAVVLAEMGERHGARELLARFRAPADVLAGESVLQFMTLSFAADLAVALQDQELAEDVYRALVPADGRTIAMFSGIALYGSVSLYLGRLAGLLGNNDAAATHLHRAERSHRAVGARPYLLRTLAAQADLAVATGDMTAAERTRSEAASLAHDLGMAWLLDPEDIRLK